MDRWELIFSSASMLQFAESINDKNHLPERLLPAPTFRILRGDDCLCVSVMTSPLWQPSYYHGDVEMQAGEGSWGDKGEEARLGKRTRELGDGVTMCQPIRGAVGSLRPHGEDLGSRGWVVSLSGPLPGKQPILLR